jgi:ribosome recycling factor
MCDKERIKQLEKTLEMERELYVNIRELSKDQDRKINALKKAYDMQIDLVKALEAKIDHLLKVA